MAFWENVENVREYKGLTRKELSYLADFSLNSISTGIARGSLPAVDVACRIANVLGVSVEFLVTGSNQSNPEVKSEQQKIESAILIKKENLTKYMDKYSSLLEYFSSLSAPMQKTIQDLIQQVAEKR